MAVWHVCPQCRKEFDCRSHPQQRFCSASCAVVWQHKERAAKRVYPTLECIHCKQAFPIKRKSDGGRKYCSRRCLGASRRGKPTAKPKTTAQPKRAPWAWNGPTQYSVVVVKCDYRLSCVMCGDLRTFRMTRERADLLRKAGLFGRCGRCGSSTLEFEPDQGVRENVAHLVGWARTPLDNWETRVDAELARHEARGFA